MAAIIPAAGPGGPGSNRTLWETAGSEVTSTGRLRMGLAPILRGSGYVKNVEFGEFREHLRPWSSYTEATDSVKKPARALSREGKGAVAKFELFPLERCRKEPPAFGLLETSRFPVIKNPLVNIRKGFLIGGNRLAQEESR